MRERLHEHFSELGASWTDPDGGFFLWLTLPEEIDTEALFPLALAEGVAFIPGPAFSVNRRFSNALRLAFSACSGERTDLGVAACALRSIATSRRSELARRLTTQRAGRPRRRPD